MLTAEGTVPSVQRSGPRSAALTESQLGLPTVQPAQQASQISKPSQHRGSILQCKTNVGHVSSRTHSAAASPARRQSAQPSHPSNIGAPVSGATAATGSESELAEADDLFSQLPVRRATSCHPLDGAGADSSSSQSHEAKKHDLSRASAPVPVATLPSRQQQKEAISRLRKPLAVVTQKKSLIRYTRDGRRYWRWKDVVARVLHICRGASADDYSLLLQTEHWLEACDSKHRYGSNLKPYFKAWLESSTHQSFFKWLDEGDGVHVDIKERPRSKLDSDRVVYCGIERCFFEVTIHKGLFKYRISKRLVTTDSARDQPPCPPELGKTMASIRSQTLDPIYRQMSPHVLSTVRSGTPPASPMAAVPGPTQGLGLWEGRNSEDCAAVCPALSDGGREGQAAALRQSEAAVAGTVNSVQSSPRPEVVPVGAGTAGSGPGSIPRVLPSGRVSVDGASSTCSSVRKPGLLTQEFCRAAGMPHAQRGEGVAEAVPTWSRADSAGSTPQPFATDGTAVPRAATILGALDERLTRSKLDSLSEAGIDGRVDDSVASAGPPAEEARADRADTIHVPSINVPRYPYQTDDRFAGGWLGPDGVLCMRPLGVNSLPAGLFGGLGCGSTLADDGSGDEDGISDDEPTPFGRSGSFDLTSASSPPCSGASSPQLATPTQQSQGEGSVSVAVPAARSLGYSYPSMPRLGDAGTQMCRMAQPPSKTLRFPMSSLTPEEPEGRDDTAVTPPVARRERRGDVWPGSSYVFAGNSASVDDASTRGHVKGWEVLRSSFRASKERMAQRAAAPPGRLPPQRRPRKSLDKRVDPRHVSHPRLASNSTLTENLKLLDLVETMAAPCAARSSRSSVQRREEGEREVAEKEGEQQAVMDLADMLEVRMVSTGQLVKVETQAQLEEMLPCAPKLLGHSATPSSHRGAERPLGSAGQLPGGGQAAEVSKGAEVSKHKNVGGTKGAGESKEGGGGSREHATVPAAPVEKAKDGVASVDKAREKWIYVWDMHSRLYINRKMPGRFHHSSFVAGGAVKAAGSIVVEDGVLKQLTTWSGHYRPRASDIALFLQWLESNMIDMQNVELLLVKPHKPQSKMNKPA